MIRQDKSRLVEFNIKDLKFLKPRKNPQEDLERSQVVLGFLSYLYTKLLGQLTDKKGGIGIFYGKALNANYSEFVKIKRKSSSTSSFELLDFKYPFLGLIFYRQDPETIVEAENTTLEYFRNIYLKYAKPQKTLKPFNFYNYFYLYSPEDIAKISSSDVLKTIKPAASPKYKSGKIDLSTVFISNYLLSNFKKEFSIAIEEIKAYDNIDKLSPKKKSTGTALKPKELEKPRAELSDKEKENLDKLQKAKDNKLKPQTVKPLGNPVPDDLEIGKPLSVDLKKPTK